jgi:peptide/nickel transport system permease protein
MLDYVAQRLVQAVFVMLVVAAISFSLVQFVGDPVNNMLGQEATAAERQALREQLGLEDPIPVQFVKWVGNAVQGEFGVSYRMGRPVQDLIADRLPATLELVFVSAILAIAVGVPMGVYTGLHRSSWLSRVFLTVSLVGISLPTFLIGILLILIFGVWLGWLPTFGRGGLVDLGPWETSFLTLRGWSHLILPAITLALFQLTLIMRLVRAEMLEVLRTDYIKFARARGLKQRSINFGHALKNTLVPVITIMGLQIGALLAFSIITETVFQWPGMGLLIIQAIRFGDIPIMSSYLVLVALFFVIINLIVDLLYYVVDPRLRIERPTTGH